MNEASDGFVPQPRGDKDIILRHTQRVTRTFVAESWQYRRHNPRLLAQSAQAHHLFRIFRDECLKAQRFVRSLGVLMRTGVAAMGSILLLLGGIFYITPAPLQQSTMSIVGGSALGIVSLLSMVIGVSLVVAGIRGEHEASHRARVRRVT